MSIAVVAAVLLAAGPAAPVAAPVPDPDTFFATETCQMCHPATVEQHLQSHHEKSWSNPLFQAQLFGEVMPAAAAEPARSGDVRGCVTCHAPGALVGGGRIPTSPGDVPAGAAGVTCDACHTIAGYQGKRPQDGNAVWRPGTTRYGPLQGLGDWHHAYLELQTRSELCAICHEATNRHGVRVKATYSEWTGSPQAGRGVQCQDCHMTVDGFLIGGVAHHRGGTAAVVLGEPSPARARLHTHRFPGAHSRSQVEGALGLAIATSPAAPLAGAPLELVVTVDNSRAGHSFPTGSADLRLLWLEVEARSATRSWTVPAKGRWGPGWADGRYEIAGDGPLDPAVAGGDVPRGSRVYRVVLAGPDDRPTLASWDARRVVADTRLRAAEVRREHYQLLLPGDLAGPLTVTAVLRYQSAPHALTDRHGLPAAAPVEVARASRSVEVRAAR